mgnify:CR=1 FL=1
MEILQTIWNALTSENEILLNIVSIPMTFIEAIITLLLFSTLLNISFSKKQGVLYVFSFSIVALISTYFIPTPYNTFINIMAFPVLVYFILKTNALKSILAEIIIYTIMFLIVTPLISIYTSIFHVTSFEVSVVPAHKILYSIILYAILLFIYILLKLTKFHITFFDRFDHFSYNLLIINFVVGIVSIFLQAYIEFLYIDFIPTSLIVLSLVVLLVYFFISLYSLFRTSKLEQTEQLLEEEKMYNKTLNTLHDNIRGFKHDFNNIVQAIGGYVSTNNIEGLKVYYRDLLKDCQINNNLAVLNPELINNPAIYSLLADKYYKAEELNIQINLEVFVDLNNLNIKTYELTRILGILLDNAIEASSKCENKVINITFRKDKSNKILIIIQNTYTNKDINIDRIFEKGYTSKEDNANDENSKNHGLGLWEVRKYLRKHTNLDLFTTKNENFFTQQFEIYDN